MLDIILGDDDGITLGLNEGIELGFSVESCDGFNYGKLEGILL